MTLHFKFDAHLACKAILREHLERLGVTYEIPSMAEVVIKNSLSADQQNQLTEELKKYGIEMVTNQKNMLIQKIKDTITEMVYSEDKLPSIKISAYLSEKLNHSSGYLSNVFSEVTYSSIENFIILQKIERAKQLIIAQQLSLTEIAYNLNYSSVAHLSNQFKQTTGITPTAFQRIIKKRRNPDKVAS